MIKSQEGIHWQCVPLEQKLQWHEKYKNWNPDIWKSLPTSEESRQARLQNLSDDVCPYQGTPDDINEFIGRCQQPGSGKWGLRIAIPNELPDKSIFRSYKSAETG